MTCLMHFPVTMRAAPSITITAKGSTLEAGTAWDASTAMSQNGSTTEMSVINNTQSGGNSMNKGDVSRMAFYDLLFSAEL